MKTKAQITTLYTKDDTHLVLLRLQRHRDELAQRQSKASLLKPPRRKKSLLTRVSALIRS